MILDRRSLGINPDNLVVVVIVFELVFGVSLLEIRLGFGGAKATQDASYSYLPIIFTCRST